MVIIIIEALFIDGSSRRIINAEEITKYEYQSIYRGKVFCPYEDCNARFEFVDLKKNRTHGCFRTFKNDQHKQGCPNEIIKDKKKARRISVNSDGGIELSLSHVKNVLSDTYILATEGKSRKDSGGNKRKRKSSHIDENKDLIISKKKEKSLGKTVVKSTKEKQPYIFKKSVSEFLNSQPDMYCVYGIVDSVELGEDDVFIKIKDFRISMYLHFGTPFKVNYPQQFKLLGAFKKYLESINGSNVVCTCVCVTQEFNKNSRKITVGEVVDFNNISFDGLGLFSVIDFVNNLISV